MLTENEVRRRVAILFELDLAPMRKVRALLKVARSLKLQARALHHARALSAQAQDRNTAAHLDRIVRALRGLYEEVRLVAHRVLMGKMPAPVGVPSLA